MSLVFHNGALWTLLFTGTATGTFLLVDGGTEVFYHNSICRTILLTKLASDTTGLTCLHNHRTFVFGTAGYHFLCIIWNQRNQFLRADVYTFTASLTGFLIHRRNTVHNMKGSEGT